MKEFKRDRLEKMPFDMEFDTPTGRTFFHATGFEVLIGDTLETAQWWDEYVNPFDDEDVRYGRR